MNALSRQMTREIVAACQAINADPDVRVAIVSGAGERAFSAGMDLKERAAGDPACPIEAARLRVRPGHRPPPPRHLLRRTPDDRGHPRLRRGRRDWKWRWPATCAWPPPTRSLGCSKSVAASSPGAGGTQRLSRLVGKGHALKLALTGEADRADEATASGWSTR